LGNRVPEGYCVMTRRIDEPSWIVVRVEVPMQAGRVIDLAEERILAGESSNLGIEVARLGVKTPARRSSVVPIGLSSSAFFS
jgi:hypothetical protein